ncbi:phage tail protein [Nocardia sp. NPDC057663]|uniref:phage tail protein n=1 Tax=Nocardia sp. NPDC057663 TaxID=3346201 RepID=UPI00366D0104
MAATGQRVDPFRAFNFIVTIVGLREPVSFTECSGLGSTTEVLDGPRPLGGVGGGTGGHTRLPGKTTFTDITLKWGVTDSTELWQWRQDIVNGNVVRRNGSIVVFDLDNHTERARWNFVNAWPSKWEGPALSQKGDIAIATLVLAHEGLTSFTTTKA